MNDNTTMPFGKYRGARLCDLPDSYIEWLYRLDDLRDPFASSVDEEWERRRRQRRQHQHQQEWPLNEFTSTALIPAELKELSREIIDRGYRSVAKRCHPDVGGSTRDMVLLNQAAGILRRIAG